MKGRFLKKTAAAVMAAALVGGALPATFTANAFEFDNRNIFGNSDSPYLAYMDIGDVICFNNGGLDKVIVSNGNEITLSELEGYSLNGVLGSSAAVDASNYFRSIDCNCRRISDQSLATLEKVISSGTAIYVSGEYGQGIEITDINGPYLIKSEDNLSLNLETDYLAYYYNNPYAMSNLLLFAWNPEEDVVPEGFIVLNANDVRDDKTGVLGVRNCGYKYDVEPYYGGKSVVFTADSIKETRINELTDEPQTYYIYSPVGSYHIEINDSQTSYTLPECQITPPDGMVFHKWNVNGVQYDPGDVINVTDRSTVVKAKWINNGYGGKVTGASVSLDGTIGVNFYSELNSDTAKAVLSGPNGDVEITDLESTKQENGQYKFSYPVYSNQAAEKIALKLFDADGNQLDVYNSSGELDEDKAIEFSVNDYIAGYEASANTKQNDLVAALDNYCKAADNYFNGAGNTVEGISGINYNSVKGYAPTLCGNKMALLLNADTSIRIFYNGEEELANLNYGDALLTKITKGEKSYFEISNISADKLSEEFVLVIGDDELEFSALSYSTLALKKTTDQNLWNLSKALCVYADAAKAYKESL